MRPTRRGWVLVGVVVLAFATAAVYGPRGLNAVVAPGVVALAAGVWQIYRFEPPSLTREHPERGERGATTRVRLALETDTPRTARVADSIGEGLSATGAERELSLGDTTVAYDLHLDSRGERTVGPTTVVVRDVLGLVSETFTYPSRGRIVVHPRVHLLSAPKREALAQLHGGVGDDRQAVDGVRRYHRGDPLRDVHWKTSAKQPDDELVVKQFATEESSRSVEIAAESATGAGDAMADAAASVAAFLVESGVRVGLTTPSGRVPPDDSGGRQAVLDHLAGARDGSLPGGVRNDADVHVRATGDGVRVTIDDRTHDFSDLVREARAPSDAIDAAEVTP